MRPTWSVALPACLFLSWGGAAPAQLSPPSPSPERGVLTEKDAFLVMPSEIIAGPSVTGVTPSGSGRYLLVQRTSMRVTASMLKQAEGMRQPPPGEISLVLWDSQARQAREVWKASTPEAQIALVTWMPQTDTALILVRQTLPPDPKAPQAGSVSRNGLLRVTPAMEKAQVVGLTDVGDTGFLDLWVSPNLPIAVLHHVKQPGAHPAQPDAASRPAGDTLYLLGETGRLGARVDLPPGTLYSGIVPGDDGSPVVYVPRKVPGQRGLQQQYLALNARTGALTPLQKAPEYRGIAAAASTLADYPVHLRHAVAAAKDGEDIAKVGLLWLESNEKSEQTRTIIAADSSGGTLFPKGDVVVYHSQGALWAAPLLRLDKAMFMAMRDAARRAVALSSGKQLGLAIMMYAQDYDETFPTGDGINGKLAPYLKNESLFQGFSYTFGGGSLASVDRPAETELGFVTGPNGRAMIYADGHVKWRPDQ